MSVCGRGAVNPSVGRRGEEPPAPEARARSPILLAMRRRPCASPSPGARGRYATSPFTGATRPLSGKTVWASVLSDSPR